MLSKEGLRQLRNKYALMAALRAAGAPDTEPEDRARLRQLAADFPGALRELDTLPTDEITRRIAALDAALGGAPSEPWMAWLHDYHALMRAALVLKRRPEGAPSVDAAVLDALSAELGVSIDEHFIAEAANPPHGRIMVVVFERLARLHGVPKKTLWDTLFPPRGGPRPYRR